MSASEHSGPRESGQALVIMVVGIIAMLIASSIVIDGGNAWAQQRITQNGTDAAALAGATVIVQNLPCTAAGATWSTCSDTGGNSLGGSPKTDADVYAAVQASANQNGLSLTRADYVDWNYQSLGSVGHSASGSIPSGAAGVTAEGSRSVGTYLAGVAGITRLQTGAHATAMAGALRGICAASEGCSVIPVTFSINISDCAGNGTVEIGSSPWPVVDLATAQADKASGLGQYEAIVPLCKEGPGGVGWLDFGCGQLKDQILNPCNAYFDIPTWIHTTTGNPNSVDSQMNHWDNQVVLIPLFDGTCRDIPASGLLPDCTDPGNGNNLYYHIPEFAGFFLDHAYIQGDNRPACNSAPGITVTPPAGGNGGTSCLKGWFVRYVTQGPVGAFDPNSDNGKALGVQLVR